jgi:hypothetical protein
MPHILSCAVSSRDNAFTSAAGTCAYENALHMQSSAVYRGMRLLIFVVRDYANIAVCIYSSSAFALLIEEGTAG